MRVRTVEWSRKGGFEDQCTYVEWHPKLWCLDHNMKDVKQRASSAALLSHAQGKVSAQEGT